MPRWRVTAVAAAGLVTAAANTVLDRLRRWRPRIPLRLGGARRAGLAALALFALTTTLAVLLAVLFHLGVATLVVTILGGVPALYLAWAALPGAISPPEASAGKKLARGRPATQWKPVELGVHQVIGGGPMPAYIRRPHDELLAVVLDPAVTATRLVVVRGGSSTGKTRAAYQAVTARLGDWQLDYPLDPGALKERLDAGVPAQTVLWLGELRQYADADGGPAVLARLADLLGGDGHIIIITTVWAEQWKTYTAAARAGTGAADAAGTTGRLLMRPPELTGRASTEIDPADGGVIDIPPEFTAADLDAAARTGDPLLADAAAAADAAGQAGRVTQYLAGARDLLDRYAGPGGDPYGQAIITAAMDATRLGHARALPTELIQEAAVGYLTDLQRTAPIATWRNIALAWAAAELNGAVRALRPVPPATGTGVAGYRVADYLDQHGRRTRQDQLGPASLWDALNTHATTASDLTRLGQAAQDRGLYRHAAALWTTAVTVGSASAARQLISHLRQVSPGDAIRAAQWAVNHVSLDDPWMIRWLLRALRDTGASDAARALATRAAATVSLDDPLNVALLLRELRANGADDAVAALLARDPAGRASLDDPQAITELLLALHEAGASNAVTALLAREPAGRASLDDPLNVAYLLRVLRANGAADAVAALLARDPAGRASLDDPQAVTELLHELGETGDSRAALALGARAAAHVSLDNPQAIASLIQALATVGTLTAAHTLASRAADRVSLDDPQAITALLHAIREAGADDAAAILASRAADHAGLDAPPSFDELRRQLRDVGEDGLVPDLARWEAVNASLNDPRAIADLMQALHEAGTDDAVAILALRANNHVSLDDPAGIGLLLQNMHTAGRDNIAIVLANRAASDVSLDDPRVITDLLGGMRAAGAYDAIDTLLARDPASHVGLDDPDAITLLVDYLDGSGANDAARTLADRAANGGLFGLFLEVYPAEASSYPFGREPDGTPSQSWNWQKPTG